MPLSVVADTITSATSRMSSARMSSVGLPAHLAAAHRIMEDFVKSISWLGALALGAFCITSAQATPVTVNYSGPDETYFAYPSGGSVTSGGFPPFMYHGGDHVQQTFSIPFTSITSLDYSFSITNALYSGNATLWIWVYTGLGDTLVDTMTVPSCNGCGLTQTYDGAVSFAPLTGDGTYTFVIELSDTLAAGAGSLQFRSGTFTVDDAPSSNGVPEPATLALAGAGLAWFGAVRRRKLTSVG